MGTTLIVFQLSGTFLSQSQICFCPLNKKNNIFFLSLQNTNCIISEITSGCHSWYIIQQESNSFLQSSHLYQRIFSWSPASSSQIFVLYHNFIFRQLVFLFLYMPRTKHQVPLLVSRCIHIQIHTHTQRKVYIHIYI